MLFGIGWHDGGEWCQQLRLYVDVYTAIDVQNRVTKEIRFVSPFQVEIRSKNRSMKMRLDELCTLGIVEHATRVLRSELLHVLVDFAWY